MSGPSSVTPPASEGRSSASSLPTVSDSPESSRAHRIVRGRRHRASGTAAAYAHAVAVTRDERRSADLAIMALRRGGVARVAVIAQARFLSLQALGDAAPVPRDALAREDVRELALQLAGTRPGLERAIVDLETRYGLDTTSFGRALGITASRAIERSRAVQETWHTVLDPALMANLGAAGCEQLADILHQQAIPLRRSYELPSGELRLQDVLTPSEAPEHEAATLALLLDAAPAVGAHADGCDSCGSRLRTMTGVRSLVSSVPVPEVPDRVAKAAPHARRRIGTPPPPSIERQRLSLDSWRRVGIVVAGALALTALAFAVYEAVSDRADQNSRVNELLEQPVGNSLRVTNDSVSPADGSITVSNDGDAVVLWHAEASVSGLDVEPSDGRLAPDEVVTVQVVPVEGFTQDGAVTITGSDASQQVVRYQP